MTRVSGMIRKWLVTSIATLSLVGFDLSTALAQEGGHSSETAQSFGVVIDPAAIRETNRLGPRSFSPYANRTFPARPLWGDQHVHSGWSFDAGFINALSPKDALRFA
ncbi:MAG: DUF3604 domain-containing protein, partial [Gammaproteobacteria bacterium]